VVVAVVSAFDAFAAVAVAADSSAMHHWLYRTDDCYLQSKLSSDHLTMVVVVTPMIESGSTSATSVEYYYCCWRRPDARRSVAVVV